MKGVILLAEQWINEGVQKGIQQGIRQGMEKGMVQDVRELILEAVSSRFGTVPEDMALKVNALDSRALLKILLRQAVVCADLAEFRKALNELKI